jgi:hypothetical protein
MVSDGAPGCSNWGSSNWSIVRVRKMGKIWASMHFDAREGTDAYLAGASARVSPAEPWSGRGEMRDEKADERVQ